MLRASSCWKPTLLTTVAVGLSLAEAAAQTQASGRRPPTAETQVELTEGTNMAIALRPGSGDLALDLVGRIWLLAEDEEVARSLTIPEADARQPAWSPDGARIVFQSYLDGNWHLWTVGTDGEAPTRLTSGPFDDREPHWSPAGDRIVFASDRGGSYDIWELELAGLTLRPTPQCPPTAPPSPTSRVKVRTPTWFSWIDPGTAAECTPAEGAWSHLPGVRTAVRSRWWTRAWVPLRSY